MWWIQHSREGINEVSLVLELEGGGAAMSVVCWCEMEENGEGDGVDVGTTASSWQPLVFADNGYGEDDGFSSWI